jgi:hypothetical protein
MTEFYGGVLFIVQAGEGAHLAVIGEEYADAGLIGQRMGELVEQLGDRLRADPRTGARTGARVAGDRERTARVQGSSDGTSGKQSA